MGDRTFDKINPKLFRWALQFLLIFCFCSAPLVNDFSLECTRCLFDIS